MNRRDAVQNPDHYLEPLGGLTIILANDICQMANGQLTLKSQTDSIYNRVHSCSDYYWVQLVSYKAQTKVHTISAHQPSVQVIAEAAQIIRQGGLVAFPTETVYGLGADALNETAVQHIFTAKGRPANDPIIVHLAALDQLSILAVDPPEITFQLADKFWPGALTIVLPKHPTVPGNVTAGKDTIAIRMPDHPVALALIEAADIPIGAPSANRFSRPSPTYASHVLEDLQGQVDIILDAGPTSIGVESTILDLTSANPTILRPGGIPLESLQQIIPSVAFRPMYLGESQIAPAPGTLLKHYSPNADVRLFDGDAHDVYPIMQQMAKQMIADNRNVGILAMDDEAPYWRNLPARVVLLGQDAEAAASNLFAGIRNLDAHAVDIILARMPERAGLGLAVWDRLIRAAEGNITVLKSES